MDVIYRKGHFKKDCFELKMQEDKDKKKKETLYATRDDSLSP